MRSTVCRSNFDIISGAFNVELINSIIGRQRALNASDINENSSDINENSAERSLSILCKHIESDPKLFVSTILNTSVNQIAGVSPNEVDIHLLSIINLFRDHDHLHVLLNPLMTEVHRSLSDKQSSYLQCSDDEFFLTRCCLKTAGAEHHIEHSRPVSQELKCDAGYDNVLSSAR